MGKQKLRDVVFTSPQACLDYVLSGKAEFQLRSEITAKYLDFRVEAANEGIWWVSHRPDGEYLWQLVAEISYRGLEAMGGSDPVEPQAFRAFGYFWRALVQGRFADDLEAVHTNLCNRCRGKLKPT